MTATKHLGHCLCKQVRFSIQGEVRDLCCCHCESCRRASGAPFVAWGTVELENLQIVEGKVAIVKSSANVERGFCAHCGSCLTYRHAHTNDEIDFTLASLDDPTVFVPRYHIWVQDKLPWVNIDDGLLQYQTTSGLALGEV